MKSLLASTLLPALALAHGHVEKVVADGVTYQGWNAAFKYNNPIPATVGWQADNLDNGFVSPDRFGSADIACHKQSKSNGAAATVKAGGKVTLQWVRHSTYTYIFPSLIENDDASIIRIGVC
jgi:cellulase